MRDELRLPFPPVPADLHAEHAPGELWLRPFGLKESDLAVDFHQALRPLLVTEVLRCCTESAAPLAADFFWALTISTRIECLLTVACGAQGAGLPVVLRCPETGCREPLELELLAEEIAGLRMQMNAVELIAVACGDARLYLRRPTGRDQLAWLDARFADEETATRTMLRSLLDEDAAAVAAYGQTSEAVLARAECVRVLNDALEEHDPLVSFKMIVGCPYCNVEHAHEVDLAELALERLRQQQRRLVADIHLLARHYHWSEAQIFAVPHWRRALYLNIIAREENP